MNNLKVQFQNLLESKGLVLNDIQWEQFNIYHRELVEWNEKMNLTAITELEQVFIKHFYDSLSLSFFINVREVVKIADIGSGAGFPSIPLKIMFPHLKVTIIDSLNKRIQFLNHLVSSLGVSQVDCIHARAEDAGRDQKYRDHFDLVTARAVARLSVLNEFCLPFVKKGGMFAAMKGANGGEEVDEASYSINALNGKLKEIHSFSLPVEEAERNIIIISKTGTTPKTYPRKAGIPLKNPLV
jgi:16S rRNA (guanine527-N7)-methyltransferase